MKPATTVAAAVTKKEVGELMKDATIAPATQKEEEGADIDPFHLDPHGDIVADLPQDEWTISAILVQSRGGLQAQQLIYNFKVVDDRATAVNPASVMREFFNVFLAPGTRVLLLIAAFVVIVAA